MENKDEKKRNEKGANKNRKKTRIDSIASEYINVQDGNAHDIAQELRDTCSIAVVNAIKDYIRNTAGLDKYAQAIDKSEQDDDYLTLCATTTDTQSVDYCIGKMYNGNVSVVGNILAKVIGSRVRTLDKQIRELHRAIVGSRIWTKASDNHDTMSVLVPQLWGEQYPSIMSNAQLLARVIECALLDIISPKRD